MRTPQSGGRRRTVAVAVDAGRAMTALLGLGLLLFGASRSLWWPLFGGIALGISDWAAPPGWLAYGIAFGVRVLAVLVILAASEAPAAAWAVALVGVFVALTGLYGMRKTDLRGNRFA